MMMLTLAFSVSLPTRAYALLGSTTTVVSSLNPSAFGSSVTFTATVTGVVITPTGTVTFKDGATTLGSATLDGSGQTSFSTGALTTGSHSITAVYGGDLVYNSSTSAVLTQTVNLLSSTTAVVSSLNPSAFGSSVTFTATVTGVVITPTGAVTFKDGATTLGSATLDGSGQASFSTGTLTTGSHSITAVYGGDFVYNTSTSAVLTQTVNPTASTTVLTSSVNPSAPGQSVTFTATVSGPAGTATGTVTFKDGATTIGSASLAGGQASFSTNALAAGSHSITAVYGGDTNYGASTSAVLTQTVNLLSSTTAVVSSLNPSAFGSSVTFTATVTGVVITPTGTVTFKDGATTLGSATLDGSGQATFSTGTLTVGSHSITAVYGGDLLYNSSTSAVLTQTVNLTASTTALTSSVNPSAPGQSVTFTATVSGSAGTATGTVTFKDGATTIGSTSLASGQASFSTSALAAGSHSITAVYGGDTNYAASTSAVLTQTVNQAASTTAVVSSLNPSAFGSSVTFTATVSGSAGTATGTVTFKDGATTIGSAGLAGGQASFSTSALAAGSHSITAVYGGDTNYTASTSAVLTQTVNVLSSTTAVVSSLNPSASGSSVTFTATVTGVVITPTGTVTIKDGATTLGSATLNGSGQASIAVATLAAGSHSITAVYGGDLLYNSSTSAVLTQTVNQAASATAITSSVNPSASGQSVTFTATVSGSAGTPTGTVTFKDGATTIGSGSLTSGQASFSTNALTAGSHSITAVYGGDTNYGASTSAVLTQTVNVLSSTTAVVSSLNPSALGSSVTFTATVTGVVITPTGTVTFKDGATTLGSAALNGSGQASIAVATLAAGSHSITAIYSGDLLYNSSTSVVLTQTVNQAASTTAITSSVNPSAPGQSVIFTATVSGPAGTPTGTVTFKDGATTIGSASLAGGQASFSTSTLAAGTHSITAVYGGNTNYTASTSAALTQTVSLTASTTALTSSVNPSAPGQSVTFTATVSGSAGTPTGTITFKDGVATIGSASLASGQASFSTSALAAGSHAITAVYGGDTNYTASTSAVLTQTVNQAASTTAITSPVNPSAPGQSVTFTATVSGSAGTPTGTVTFKDGATTIGSASLASGQASFSTSTLAVGVHSITAVYGGDANYTASTSAVLTQTCRGGSVTVNIASSANPSMTGQTINLLVTVVGNMTTPTGTVTYKDNKNILATVPLTAGSAKLTTAALSAGEHSIVAFYSGDANYGAATSNVLAQTVNIPADSTRLRKLQEIVTGVSAQLSGQAISGSMDTAIAAAFVESCNAVIPNGSGFRLSMCPEQSPSTRINEGFAALSGSSSTWDPWFDVRGTDWNSNAVKGDVTGRQINGTAGITYRISRSLIVGVLAGYEAFTYSSEALGGHLRGDGWVTGTYFAWRPTPGIRFDAGAAYTSSNYVGSAGSSHGSFQSSRWLIKTGITGTHTLSNWEVEPSARIFATTERDEQYVDSLRTIQAGRNFLTGRASAGSKVSYRWQFDRAIFATYLGMYEDYYFTYGASSTTPSTAGTKGLSARFSSGLSINILTNAVLSIEGNVARFGHDFSSRSLSARAFLSF